MIPGIEDLNLWAVLVAALLSFLIGALWYGLLFSKAWVRMHGFSEEQLRQISQGQFLNLAIFLLCDLIMASVLAALVPAIGVRSAGQGALLGLIVWLGFAFSQALTLNSAAGKPIGVLAIDTGKQLVALIVMGAILGVWQ